MAEPSPAWTLSPFSFGVDDRFEQPLFPHSDKLNPSSSTETESQWPDALAPMQQPLTSGQRESARECATVGKRWIQTHVPKDYLAGVRPPHWTDGIVRLVKTGTWGNAPSIMVPQPKETDEESQRLQKRFSTFWFSVFCVIIFFGLRWSFVWLLQKLWVLGKQVDDWMSEYISDFKKWRKNIDWDLYRCGPALRGIYGKGDVWILFRDLVCFRVPMHLVQTDAPNLLKGSFNCYIGPTNGTHIHVVETVHSSIKVHAFLAYLDGLPFQQTMQLVQREDVFPLRKALHSMAREYADDDILEKRKDMFTYREWVHGPHSNPLDVLSIACRTKNVNTSLAKEAILKLGDLQFQQGGYIDKMHRRNAKAFGTAHEIISETFIKGRQIAAPRGYAHENEERKEAALLLLANEFCQQLKLAGFSKSQVKKAENTLKKPSRHEPPLDMTPAAVAVRAEEQEFTRTYSIHFAVLLHAVWNLNLPI